MSASWIKEVKPEDLHPDKDYFIAMKGNPHIGQFWSCMLNGKTQWTCKPGIALKYAGNQALKDKLIEHSGEITAIEVPKDATTRWRARKHAIPRRR